tara:strand:+ start:1441 stop:1653 length:213 start_codon:yes stop_codon:yes gene_type:complete
MKWQERIFEGLLEQEEKPLTPGEKRVMQKGVKSARKLVKRSVEGAGRLHAKTIEGARNLHARTTGRGNTP